MTVESSSLLWLVFVSAIWGISTPFLKAGSRGIAHIEHRNIFYKFALELKFMTTNWKFFVPFLINQSGSIIYTISLAKNDLSLAVPLVNSLNFTFVMLTGYCLGEDNFSKTTFLGIALILFGIFLCIVDRGIFG